MGGELTVLGSGVGQLYRFALHVTGLAGGDGVFDVEGKRRLLGERRVLPLVVERDGALPFVVVELTRKGGLVAGGAELRCFVEGLHDGRGVAVEVSEDLAIGDRPGDGFAVFVDAEQRARR